MPMGMLAFALVLLAPSVGRADAVGAASLNVPMSVRQAGMGEVSIAGNDLMRAWSNPALLAARPGPEIALASGSLFLKTRAFGLGGATMLNRSIAVGSLVSLNGISFKEIDTDGFEVGGTTGHDTAALGIVAAVQRNWLRAGLAVKYVRDSAAGDAQSVGAADAGLAGIFNSLSVGIAARNLGGVLREASYDPEDWPFADPADLDDYRERLPIEVRAGLAYTYEPMKVTGGLEFVKVDGQEENRLCFGAEWWAANNLALRLGIAGLQTEYSRQFTMGVTALMNRLGLDLALATHPIGTTLRGSVSYAFNAVSAESRPAKEPKPVKPEPTAEPAAVESGNALNLAVAELEPQNVSAGDAAVIADMLRNALVRAGAFNIVEKKNMDKLLAEQAFQQTGCTSEECAVKLGKLLNVQRIVVGSFGSLLNRYFISVRVIDVESGKVVFGDSAKGDTVDEIEVGVNDLASRIAKQAH